MAKFELSTNNSRIGTGINHGTDCEYITGRKPLGDEVELNLPVDSSHFTSLRDGARRIPALRTALFNPVRIDMFTVSNFFYLPIDVSNQQIPSFFLAPSLMDKHSNVSLENLREQLEAPVEVNADGIFIPVIANANQPGYIRLIPLES